MRHVAFWAGWWVALFWLWLLLAGVWDRQDLIAAAAAAAVAATIGEFARARARFVPAIPVRALADLPPVLARVVVDFGIVAVALLASVARRDVVRGEFVERRLERPGDAVTAARRGWVALAATYSPNAYVVDVEAKDASVVLHDLVPNRKSESPA